MLIDNHTFTIRTDDRGLALMALDHKVVDVVGFGRINGRNAISRDQHIDGNPSHLRFEGVVEASCAEPGEQFAGAGAEPTASLPDRDVANAVDRCVLPTPTAPRTSMQWPASAKRNEPRSDNARRSAGRRVRFRCRSACSDSTRPSPNVMVPNAIRGVTLRRPKQFQEGEVAELVLSGQRQSLRQDVLRCAEFEGCEIAIHQISFPHSIIEHPSTGLIPLLRPPS